MLLALMLYGLALADEPEDLAVNTQLFRPSPDAETFLWVDDATPAPNLGWSVRAVAQYARDLLRATADDGAPLRVVGDVWQLDAIGALTLGPVRVALDVPVLLRATSDLAAPTTGLGDAWLDVRATALRRPAHDLGLAFGAAVRLPTSTRKMGLGGRGVGVELRAAADGEVGRTVLAGTAGVLLAQDGRMDGRAFGSAAQLRGGAAYRLSPRGGLAAELAAQLPFRQLDGALAVPVEAMGSGWVQVGRHYALRAGLGAGLTPAVGTPTVRALIAVERRALDRDPDGDGLFGRRDRCPYIAETFNGIRDEDGCPEDAVVLESEATAPASIVAGAPDDPQVAVASRFPMDLHDPDGDGIPTDIDGCPTDAEDLDGFQDGDGCPDLDNDGDGIPDALDACPNAAETFNGYADTDGCPDGIPDHLEGIAGVVRGITFESGSDRLTPGAVAILRRVRSVMHLNDALRLGVWGHTDDVGGEALNVTLSERRAEAVRQWLIEAGVDGQRISTRGFGPLRPIAPNDTPAGRAENRRVELIYEALEE